MGRLAPYYILRMHVKPMEVISKTEGLLLTKNIVVEAVLHSAHLGPVKINKIKQKMWEDLLTKNGWNSSSTMKQAATFDEPIEVEHGCKPITYRI